MQIKNHKTYERKVNTFHKFLDYSYSDVTRAEAEAIYQQHHLRPPPLSNMQDYLAYAKCPSESKEDPELHEIGQDELEKLKIKAILTMDKEVVPSTFKSGFVNRSPLPQMGAEPMSKQFSTIAATNAENLAECGRMIQSLRPGENDSIYLIDRENVHDTQLSIRLRHRRIHFVDS